MNMLGAKLTSSVRLVLATFIGTFVGLSCVANLDALRAQEATNSGATGIEASLPTIRQLNDPVVLLNALNGAAMQKMQAGDIDKAIEYIDESISIARKQGNPNELRAPLMTATMILNKTSPERASKFMIGLLNEEAGEDSGNVAVERVILEQLGTHLQQSGDIVAAIQVFHDFQLKCKQEDPQSETTAWALLQYGQACLNGRMFDLAQPALAECKKLAESLGRDEIAASGSGSLANACLGTQQYDLAIKLFLSQLESAKKAGDENLAVSAIAGVVTALLSSNRKEDAAQVLENNLPQSKGIMRGELFALKSTLELLNQNPQAALENIQAAADARLSGIPFLARAFASSATIMNDKLIEAYVHLQLGQNDESLRAVRDAEKGYRQIEKQMKRAAQMGAVNLDSVLTGYSILVSAISDVRQQVLVNQGKVKDALLESEAGRGQAQIQVMQRLFQASDADIDQANSNPSLDRILQTAKETGATFVEYSVVQPMDHLTRSRVNPDDATFQSKRVFAWVVKPTGEIHFEDIAFDRPLKQFVAELREEIAPEKTAPPTPKPKQQQGVTTESDSSSSAGTADRDDQQQTEESQQAADDATAERLSTEMQQHAYDRLWQPIKQHLPNDPSQTVVIVPHADLFAVPFAALLSPDHVPVIESHTILTSGSIELYRLAWQRRRGLGKFDVKDVLVVGNPEMPKYRFRPDKPAAPLDPLPGSEREAKAIASMFGITPLLGGDASESSIKEKMLTAPVIHMATHGLLEADSIFTRNYLSSMALAPDADSDGFLTVREVMEMELDAELAVLSACDSGRGEITGDGVVGLSRAYLSAGVPTVVVSLWPVSDQATAYMMVQFYGALAKGQSKAAALRTAILKTREQAGNPRLWAPFTLYGVGR